MSNWDNLRIVLEIQRCGSVGAASRSLGVNYSTIKRRLASYEAALGAALFESSPKGQVCTAFGVRICDAAERMEEELFAAERAILGQDALLEGELRVTMPDDFFYTLLVSEIAAFSKAYPDIRLNITLTNEISDLAKREADIAFRFSNNPLENLVGIRIVNCAQAIYASPDYLACHPNPRNRSWIRWKNHSRRLDSALKNSDPEAIIKHQALNILAQLHMAAHGMGLVMISCFLGDQDSRLVRVPPGKSKRGRDLWILTHEDLRNTARVHTFMTFMRDRLQQYKSLFKGEIS